MRRRSFLQGMAAVAAAILTPFKGIDKQARTTGYLRVQIPTFKWHCDDLDPTNRYGSFNLFLNTSHTQRMVNPAFQSYEAMTAYLGDDRAMTPYKLGPDRRDPAYLRQHILHAIYEVNGHEIPLGG